MRIILLTLSFILISSITAQTKWIAHKSHSGSGAGFFMDNGISMFGPGDMRMDVRIVNQNAIIPTSTLPLKFEVHNTINFPMVSINWNKLTLSLIDKRDSLISFSHDFTHFLPKGAIIYNRDDLQFYLYDYQIKDKLYNVTDSIQPWKIQNKIEYLEDFISSKEHGEIWFDYPRLSYDKVDEIIATSKMAKNSQHNIKKRKPKVCKKPTDTIIQKPIIEKQNNIIPVIYNSPKQDSLKKSHHPKGIQINYLVLILIATIFLVMNYFLRYKLKEII